MVHEAHPLASHDGVQPQHLRGETLITYPVSLEQLDIYTRFLVPACCRQREHNTVETFDLMLQRVAAGHGISVLPDRLVREDDAHLSVRTCRLRPDGIEKALHLDVRRGEQETDYIAGFLRLAREAQPDNDGVAGLCKFTLCQRGGIIMTRRKSLEVSPRVTVEGNSTGRRGEAFQVRRL